MTDAHVKMALRLQAAFGLRREEASKFSPSWADRGEMIVVRASTAKGGRARNVAIPTDGQRSLLDEALRLVKRPNSETRQRVTSTPCQKATRPSIRAAAGFGSG